MIFYYLMVLLIPFGAHPLLAKPYAGGIFTPIKVLGALSLLACLIEAAGTRAHTTRAKISQLEVWFLVFSAVFLLSTLLGDTFSIEAFFRYIAIALFYVSTIFLITSRRRLERTLVLIIVTMVVSSLYMFREFIVYGHADPRYRPGGTFGDPNYYALTALACLPLVEWGYRSFSQRIVRLAMAAGGAIIIGGLVLSQSRGGFIALLVMMVFMVVKRGLRLKFILLFTCIIGLNFYMIPNTLRDRFRSRTSETISSTSARKELLLAGLRIFRDNYLLGVGPGNFPRNAIRYSDIITGGHLAHNSYIEAAGETGVAGVLSLCMVWFGGFRLAGKLRSEKAESLPWVRPALDALQTGIVGFCVGAVFLSAQYEKVIWLFSFLLVAIDRISSVTATETAPRQPRERMMPI